MKEIFKLITKEKHEKLMKVLGGFDNAIRPLSICVYHDRNDPDLISEMISFSDKSKKIADILEVPFNELVLSRSDIYSDHESVVHEMTFENELQAKSYCIFNEQLFFIDKIENGVLHLTGDKQGEQQVSTKEYLKPASWSEVFSLRK